jgi:uncharacterized protein
MFPTMDDDQLALSNFSGEARLFPLPNLVFFPHVMQPLHIFEQRYRDMTADALSEDRLIALALLRAGWESDYDNRPAIHPIICVGRIIADQQLPDGRYNLLLRGISRARILEELTSERLYRSARVELLIDEPPAEISTAVSLRKRLATAVMARFGNVPAANQLRELFDSELPLGQLTDVLAFALPLPIERKQLMLAETNSATRAGLLTRAVEESGKESKPKADDAKTRKFPPDFSAN